MTTQTRNETRIEKDLLRVGEVARMKGVSHVAVSRRIAQGKLHVLRIGGMPFIPRSEAEAYMTVKRGRQKGWNKLERSNNDGHSK